MTPRAPRLTKNQRTLFTMLHAAGANGLAPEAWNDQARKAGLNDIRTALLSKGLVRTCGDRLEVAHE